MSTKQHRRLIQRQLAKLGLVGCGTHGDLGGALAPSAPRISKHIVVSEISSHQPVTDAEIRLILSALGDNVVNILSPTSAECSTCTGDE
jgi:hypothetical protein